MLGFLILLWVVFSLVFLLFRTRRPKNFPPGPQPLPIFGNLLQLNWTNPLNDFKKLSERYGKVYSIYFGSKPVVMLNGVQAMKEALVTQSAHTSGRFQDFLINHLTDGKGVVMADGAVWKEHRRFALMTLRNLGLGKRSMEERILGETSHIASYLEKNAVLKGEAIDPHILFHKATFNIICAVLFGTRFKHDSDFMLQSIRYITEMSNILNGPWAMVYEMLPQIRRLPLPFQSTFQKRAWLNKSMAGQVSQHKESRVPGDPRDLTDCYLDEMEKRGKDGGSFSEDQLQNLLVDLVYAGSDTSSNTLLTAFQKLTTHPDVQERCQKEIEEALGEEVQVTYEDRHKMPYTLAMIHEVQRVSDTVPLSVFHTATGDMQLMGYDIPKSTVLIPNLSSVLNEECQWKFPNDFNPTNFLNDEGEFVKPEAFMPFSAGPRMCLGENLARMELFLILVTLLRRFKFIWPEDAGDPDHSLVYGITQHPKPYRMVVKLRANQ